MKNVQLASDFCRMSSLIPTVSLCLCFQTSSTSEQETQAPKPEASLAASVAGGAEQQEVSIALSTPKSRALPPCPCLRVSRTLTGTTLTACPSEVASFENSHWGLSLPRVAPRPSPTAQ